MKNKQIYKILEKTLSEFKKTYPDYANDGDVFGKVRKGYLNGRNPEARMQHLASSIEHHKEIVHYLIKLGYLEPNKLNQSKITIEGIIFLNRGGFTKQFELDRNQFQNTIKRTNLENRKNYFIILAGLVGWVIAALGYLLDKCH